VKHFLFLCGLFASFSLFVNGCDFVSEHWSGVDSAWLNSQANHQGWYFISLALVVGPLLTGVAWIIQRLDETKGLGIGWCPTCGGNLFGEFPKCPHCASDMVWESGVPMTPQQAADDQERRKWLTVGRAEQVMRLAREQPRWMREIDRFFPDIYGKDLEQARKDLERARGR